MCHGPIAMADDEVNSAYKNLARRYMERTFVEQALIERFKTFTIRRTQRTPLRTNVALSHGQFV